MYKQNKITPSTLNVNESYEGETIEQKINRIVNNKEPITDGAPLIYTERKDGVQPAYDIRTDRWEVAVEAMDAVSKTHTAKREQRIKDTQAKKEGFTDHEAKLAAQNAKKEAATNNPKDNK